MFFAAFMRFVQESPFRMRDFYAPSCGLSKSVPAHECFFNGIMRFYRKVCFRMIAFSTASCDSFEKIVFA